MNDRPTGLTHARQARDFYVAVLQAIDRTDFERLFAIASSLASKSFPVPNVAALRAEALEYLLSLRGDYTAEPVRPKDDDWIEGGIDQNARWHAFVYNGSIDLRFTVSVCVTDCVPFRNTAHLIED